MSLRSSPYLSSVSLLLNIDTAVQSASVCLSSGKDALSFRSHPVQQDHAAWLHPAIEEVLKEAGVSLHQLDAIAVSAGPGSYTGLRVGLSTAKGLCYALNKPLILLNTLQIMAASALPHEDVWLCPMIDARRMEVFTAIFDGALDTILPTRNLILEGNSFETELNQKKILFFGNGSQKFREVATHPNAIFKTFETNAQHMIELSHRKNSAHEYADLAYAEPFYGKDFYVPVK